MEVGGDGAEAFFAGLGSGGGCGVLLTGRGLQAEVVEAILANLSPKGLMEISK